MKHLQLTLMFSFILLSCSKDTIKDDTSLVTNDKSQLITMLLSRSDFDSEWNLGYGQIEQFYRQETGIDEEANYSLFTKYKPLESYQTFFHRIYLSNDKTDADDLIKHYSEKKSTELSLINLEYPNANIKCFLYENKPRQLCIYAQVDGNLKSILLVDIKPELSNEQLDAIVIPIILSVDNKIHNFQR